MSAAMLDALLSALRGIPRLPGARCRGKSHLFDEAGRDEDPEAVDQRHTQALGLCRNCAALASCDQWFVSLPRNQRPPGVVAGRKPVGRPANTTPKEKTS